MNTNIKLFIGFIIMILAIFTAHFSFAGEIDYPIPCAIEKSIPKIQY